jgi:gluconokinase
MSMAALLPRSNRPPLPPMVVMGVSGCGKSTVGAMLAAHFGIPFIEGDAMHPAANVEKMRAGHPLNDEDRWPWLDALAARLRDDAIRNGGAVASCSALKAAYRDRIRAVCGADTRFLFLDCSRETLERNVSARKGHFMPKSLLDSQLATLEPPHGEARAIVIDGDRSLDAVLGSIIGRLTAGA